MPKEATAVIDYVKQETAATASKTSEYFSKDIANLQKHIYEKFKDMATKEFVEKEISVSKTESLKWFVGLFITLALMVIGLYFKKQKGSSFLKPFTCLLPKLDLNQ